MITKFLAILLTMVLMVSSILAGIKLIQISFEEQDIVAFMLGCVFAITPLLILAYILGI